MAHIPSVLYSIIILGLYYMHLKQTDKDKYWTSIHDGLLGDTPTQFMMDESDLYEDSTIGFVECTQTCRGCLYEQSQPPK